MEAKLCALAAVLARGLVAASDQRLKQQITPVRLAAGWAAYPRGFSRQLGRGTPRTVVAGSLDVMRVSLRVASMTDEFRVSVEHRTGKVAGIFFLRPGVPL